MFGIDINPKGVGNGRVLPRHTVETSIVQFKMEKMTLFCLSKKLWKDISFLSNVKDIYCHRSANCTKPVTVIN